MDQEAAERVLRQGARTIIADHLRRSGASPERADKVADELESCCWRGATRAEYVHAYTGLSKHLNAPYGEFMETTLAAAALDGTESAARVVAFARACRTPAPPDHRRTIRGMLYAILAKDGRITVENRKAYATKIERGCYNQTIEHCANSAESYDRQWDNPMFVSVYSARAGVVAENLDLDGLVAESSDGRLSSLDLLAAGGCEPEALGRMGAAELNPEAQRLVRERVRARESQKIEEKTSAIFQCPRCRKRNCTYRQVQIGSGDEPSSFMCTCKSCGEYFEGRMN